MLLRLGSIRYFSCLRATVMLKNHFCFFQNMKGLLQKVMELSDCGRCLDDMDMGAGGDLPVSQGNVPDLRRLNRIF